MRQPEHTTDTEWRHLAPEVRKTADQLVGRHPAFGAHARFVAERLAELAHRAYQHGASVALSELLTSDEAAEALGVTRAWVTRIARRHDIGWHIGRDRLFRPDDIEMLQVEMARIQRRRGGANGDDAP